MGEIPDWVTNATEAFDRRWVESVIHTSRINDATVSTPMRTDQETFKIICGLPTDTPWPDTLAYAERLLVVWQVSDRLAA